MFLVKEEEEMVEIIDPRLARRLGRAIARGRE